MKILLKILFILFLGSMIIGFYMKYSNIENADILIGLGVLFLSFILMPLFIFYRYQQGKYKKYVLDPKSKNPFKIDKDKLE
jgi:hypothetical protein